MKLLIRNLNRWTTEEELRVLFEPHGPIESCTLRPGHQRGDEGFESNDRGGKYSSSKEAVAPAKVSNIYGNSVRRGRIYMKQNVELS